MSGSRAAGRPGDLGQDLGDLGAALGAGGPLGELGEVAQSRVAFAVRRGQRVQGGVKVDAVTGAEQGMRCRGGLQALLLDREAVGKTVVVPSRTGSGQEATGALEDVRRPLGPADRDDQPGA
ncbi:hypothetical protein [Streptomyces sp. WAC05374]|uniref:hypothetical protein n=1 Tax=Streptomyces sp. WAC05374 TaxID=2487420 RepID=UPI00135897CD|nr:hypothetical protein [Streptomyces sp. WAC05374]